MFLCQELASTVILNGKFAALNMENGISKLMLLTLSCSGILPVKPKFYPAILPVKSEIS